MSGKPTPELAASLLELATKLSKERQQIERWLGVVQEANVALKAARERAGDHELSIRRVLAAADCVSSGNAGYLERMLELLRMVAEAAGPIVPRGFKSFSLDSTDLDALHHQLYMVTRDHADDDHRVAEARRLLELFKAESWLGET